MLIEVRPLQSLRAAGVGLCRPLAAVWTQQERGALHPHICDLCG